MRNDSYPPRCARKGSPGMQQGRAHVLGEGGGAGTVDLPPELEWRRTTSATFYVRPRSIHSPAAGCRALLWRAVFSLEPAGAFPSGTTKLIRS